MARTNLSKLADAKFESIPVVPGTYRIMCLRHGRGERLQRAGGVDQSCTLYIGMTNKSLRRRIQTFWDGLHDRIPVTTPHSGANTYVLFGFRKRFALEDLYVSWRPTRRAEEEERKALNEYLTRSLDTPPLNLRVPRLWS